MAKSKVTVWLVGVAIYFGCFAMATADESVEVRQVAEAKLLFRAVLTDEPPPERCELGSTWERYPIPESVAREHLGLTVHAELSAPIFGPLPKDILDIAADGEFVCSADRAKSIEGERLREYESSVDTRLLLIRRTWYTFPVFSDDYSSAALVISHSGHGWAKMPDGVKSLREEGIGYVAIYRKIEGAWRRVTTVELFAS
jgi:hypothetical protein